MSARRALKLLTPVATAVAIVVLVGCSESSHGTMRCDGAAALCNRRLDQVVLPATHNSFSASEQPGWRFTNQHRGIARQLDDGIRVLLLDVHYGVRDPATGSVRTDLRAEGSDRNKVAKTVPPAAMRAADSVAGRVGFGTLKGAPEPYLCHSLCEFGAEPLGKELGVIRNFLEGHRDEVLILVVEDYVPGSTIDRAFDHAGLLRYVATLDRSRPLPTLGALISSGRRLIVFAEDRGGSPAWYMRAFSFIQDTPLGAKRPSQLSCGHHRGGKDDPLLLINHWIPPFPSRACERRHRRAAISPRPHQKVPARARNARSDCGCGLLRPHIGSRGRETAEWPALAGPTPKEPTGYRIRSFRVARSGTIGGPITAESTVIAGNPIQTKTAETSVHAVCLDDCHAEGRGSSPISRFGKPRKSQGFLLDEASATTRRWSPYGPPLRNFG